VAVEVLTVPQKPTLYARANVDEYWVVDLERGRVVVHRDPEANRYDEVSEVPAGRRVIAAALDLPALDVAELFAAAGV